MSPILIILVLFLVFGGGLGYYGNGAGWGAGQYATGIVPLLVILLLAYVLLGHRL